MLSFYLSMIESEEDKSKFRLIYENYRLLIYHEAHKLTDDKFMVEDIAQETFLKIIKSIKKLRYDNEKEFAGLVGIMTRNCGLNLLRSNNKYYYPEEMPRQEDETESTDREKVVIDHMTLQDVMRIIEKMDPRYSEPLRLKVHGYSSDEIGELLGISPQNARIRIHRAKKIIAEKLEK